MAIKKARKDRSDITVGKLEKKHGMPPGTVRNENGRDTRSDKQLGTIRKGAAKKSSQNGVTPKQTVVRATTARGSAGSDLSQKDSPKHAVGKVNGRSGATATMTTEELTLRSFRLARENSQSRRDG